MIKKLFIDFMWIGSILFFAKLIMIEQSLGFTIFVLLVESVLIVYLDYLTYDNNWVWLFRLFLFSHFLQFFLWRKRRNFTMTKFKLLNLFKKDYYTVIIDHYMLTKKGDNMMIMEQFHHDEIANVNTSDVKSFYNKLYSSLHKKRMIMTSQ